MPNLSYQGSAGQCRWTGFTIDDSELESMRDQIRERALDVAESMNVAQKLRDLAQTHMATEFLENFLRESDPVVENWQVGEAIAEVLLENERGAKLPWNVRRDERTVRVSLPGADIVGFIVEGEDVYFLFGEVKSSSDANVPPQVMYGRSGAIQQLEKLLENQPIQRKLIHWLAVRCRDEELSDLFDRAAIRFLESQGSDVRICGCLMRDTVPDENDVANRAQVLNTNMNAPGEGELIGCYVTLPFNRWVDMVAA